MPTHPRVLIEWGRAMVTRANAMAAAVESDGRRGDAMAGEFEQGGSVINTVAPTVPHARGQGDHIGGSQLSVTGSDDVFDGARRLLVEALQLAGGELPALVRSADPVTELREELRVRTAERVVVSCSALAGLGGLLGGDPSEVLRAEVLGQGHRLTLLHRDCSAVSGVDRRYLVALTAVGADVRLLAAPPPEVVLVGDDVAVLPDEPGARLVRAPEVVRALRRSFEAMRGVAADFAVLNGAVTTFLGSRLLAEVLGTLCAGMKDESAARQMRISVRTYRRYVASILRSLNVTSRFEAGMRLSELGLTDLARRGGAGASGGPGSAAEPGVGEPGDEGGEGCPPDPASACRAPAG